tara:strand:- start:1524 stop:1919 length:396 start_codon:yes stop_codon:yes gene_type:complete
MSFKLGSERRDIKDSSTVKIAKGRSFNSNNVKIISTPLDKGTIAEANNDGTISINSEAKISPAMLKRTIKHEMKHLKDIADGRANYGDNWVMWEGKIYFRRDGMIDGPAGRLPEGHPDHPWEQEAIAAEKT